MPSNFVLRSSNCFDHCEHCLHGTGPISPSPPRFGIEHERSISLDIASLAGCSIGLPPQSFLIVEWALKADHPLKGAGDGRHGDETNPRIDSLLRLQSPSA